MKKIKEEFPPVLLRRLALTALLGISIFLFSCIYFFTVNDRILLLLSTGLLLGAFWRCFELYRIARFQKYEVIEGVCHAITPQPFSKYSNVSILSGGQKITLKLRKHSGLKIGRRYRFYFDRRKSIHLGIDRLDTVLNTNDYLGHEAADEEQTESNPSQIPLDKHNI